MLHHVPVITRDDDADELDERELARRERALQSPEALDCFCFLRRDVLKGELRKDQALCSRLGRGD